ncbi:MAG: Na+/H+ antiporter [Marmoricola sp.]
MPEPWLLAGLLVGVIVLTPIADRIRVPQPVLLTLFGLALGLTPGIATLSLDPELILPAVLPPLLFAATQRTTAREFREHARAVLLLAVGLTVATAAVVAVVAHALGVPWTAAWVLGAIVSPPDPVAATAVARRLRLPHRLVTILEDEGMFNDATALVLFKVALAAAVTGSFSFLDTGIEFVVTLFVGLAVGFLAGAVSRAALARIEEAYTETTITVLMPFVAYVGAEHVGGSGVLAVLVLGLFLRDVGHQATTSQGWLLGRSVWSYADFLITSLAFSVLGLELVDVIAQSKPTMESLQLTAAVVGSVILFRFLYIFPASTIARARAQRRDEPMPGNWRETTVVSWSGMRGVVTVATALALPRVLESGTAFPQRDNLVIAALGCVLVTLVVQGLTLAPLTNRLGVASSEGGRREVADLRRRAAEAALGFVREETGPETTEEVRTAACRQYDGYLAAQEAIEEARALDGGERDPGAELAHLLGRASDVERDLVLRARRTGEVSAASADEVLRDIEGRALRDFG